MSPSDRQQLELEISALLDGELDDASRARLEDRIAHDVDVRAMHQSLKRTVELVRNLPQERSPVDLAALTLRHAEENFTRESKAGGWALLRWTSWVGVAAAVGLVAFLTWQGGARHTAKQYVQKYEPAGGARELATGELLLESDADTKPIGGTPSRDDASVRSKENGEFARFAESAREGIDTGPESAMAASDELDQKTAAPASRFRDEFADSNDAEATRERDDALLAAGTEKQLPRAELRCVYRSVPAQESASTDLRNQVMANSVAAEEVHDRPGHVRARVMPGRAARLSGSDTANNTVVELPPEDLPVLVAELAADARAVADIELQIGSNAVRGKETILALLQESDSLISLGQANEPSEIAEGAGAGQRQVDVRQGLGGKGGRPARKQGQGAAGDHEGLRERARIEAKKDKGALPEQVEADGTCTDLESAACDSVLADLSDWLNQESVTLNVVFSTEVGPPADGKEPWPAEDNGPK